MDSQEKQDHLKQSDIEYFLAHFGEYWQKYGLTTMIVILAFLVGVLGYRHLSTMSAVAREAAYAELAETDSPQIIQDVARRHDGVDGFAGYALLKAADNSVEQALGLLPNQGFSSAMSDEERDRKLKDAASLYERVINLNESKLQTINAHFGLAAVYESLGDFGKAAEHYGEIQQLSGEDWPNLAERAGNFAANLGDVSTPVEFPPAPLPKTEATDPTGGVPSPLAPAGPPTPLKPETSPLLPGLDPSKLPQPSPDRLPIPGTDPNPEDGK